MMAITVVQHASNAEQFTSGTSGTINATFGSNTTAGNCLIAVFSQDNSSTLSPTLSSVTTNGSSENWADSGASFAGDGFFLYIDPNTGGSQTIIDVTFAFGGTATTSNSLAIVLDTFEVSGLATTSVVDRIQNNSPGTTGTSWTSNATSTTTEAAEFWIGAVNPYDGGAANQSITITGPSSPWTNEAQLTTSTQEGGTGTSHKYFLAQMSGYQIVSATGTATYSGTNTGSGVFYTAGVATLKGAAANVNVSLTVAQVNIAALAPTVTVKLALTVAQVNIAAYPFTIKAGPVSLSVAQVNINAQAPAVRSGPISLPVAQVNINAYPPSPGSNGVVLSTAQVTINALPFILEKFFALPLAQVTISAPPPGILRIGEIEDSIVPLMATGVYSNV